ncbi:MAG: hypothetical protein HYY02_09240 [Chloroflexi bacterium]|nr:hypothetical protein [Chloroflexota bacterium]
MATRGLTRENVEYCLSHILREDRDVKGNRRCSTLLRDGRDITAVLDDKVSPPVVTVIWVRGR